MKYILLCLLLISWTPWRNSPSPTFEERFGHPPDYTQDIVTCYDVYVIQSGEEFPTLKDTTVYTVFNVINNSTPALCSGDNIYINRTRCVIRRVSE